MNSNKGKNTHRGTRIAAGEFTLWLEKTNESLKENSEADVPCGECTACCHSSYFIHITPNDSATLKHVPKQLVFPAPGLPKGHMLLGFDENGRCPMLVDSVCSIYAYRPQTCRQYDCRVFPATGLSVTDSDKNLISAQSQRWEFSINTEQGHEELSALQNAARFLVKYGSRFPEEFAPKNVTQQAIFAIRIYSLFQKTNGEDGVTLMIKKIIELAQKPM